MDKANNKPAQKILTIFLLVASVFAWCMAYNAIAVFAGDAWNGAQFKNGETRAKNCENPLSGSYDGATFVTNKKDRVYASKDKPDSRGAYGWCCPEPPDGQDFYKEYNNDTHKYDIDYPWDWQNIVSTDVYCRYVNTSSRGTIIPGSPPGLPPTCSVGQCLYEYTMGGRQDRFWCVGYGNSNSALAANINGDRCDPLKLSDGTTAGNESSKTSCAKDPQANCFSKEENVKPCEDCGGGGGDGDGENNPSVACDLSTGLAISDPAAIDPVNLGTWTALGCIPTNPTAAVNWLMKFALGVGGFLVVFRFVQGGIMMMTATGDPDKINEGREIMTSALIGLLVIAAAVALLQFIGVNILQIGGFGFGNVDFGS